MESLGDPADPHSNKPRIFKESLSNIFLKTDSVKSNSMPPKKRMNVSSNVASIIIQMIGTTYAKTEHITVFMHCDRSCYDMVIVCLKNATQSFV